MLVDFEVNVGGTLATTHTPSLGRLSKNQNENLRWFLPLGFDLVDRPTQLFYISIFICQKDTAGQSATKYPKQRFPRDTLSFWVLPEYFGWHPQFRQGPHPQFGQCPKERIFVSLASSLS